MMWVLLILALLNVGLILFIHHRLLEAERHFEFLISNLIDDFGELSNHIDIIYGNILERDYDKKLNTLINSIKNIPKEITIKNVLSI